MNKKDSVMMMRRWPWCLLIMLAFYLLPVSQLLAHGGGELKVGSAPIGSYLVSAWVNPPTVQAGQVIHVTVGIARESTGEPVLDATVNVLIVNRAGDVVATAVATTEQSVNRLFYEADLEPMPTGNYEMQVVVSGQAGEGDIAFPLTVTPRSILPWVGGIAAGLFVIGLVVLVWRRGDSKAVPRRRSVD
ncbi:hypothetical protein [Candidatus Leptofilum sp.]|uniref:hypothetical protein n=1 Tax=Candidatus Leptofilum sp. TaxID=3241576 RepID=UPI003B5CAA59